MAKKPEENKPEEGNGIQEIGNQAQNPKSPVELALESIAKELAEIKADNKKKDEKIAFLEEVADKGRVANIKSRFPTKITPIVKLSFLNGKLVTGWKMHVDDVHRDSDGIWHEKQVIKYWVEGDDQPKLMALLDFNRLIEKKEAEVVKRDRQEIPDEESGTISLEENFVVRIIDENREVSISGVFIN